MTKALRFELEGLLFLFLALILGFVLAFYTKFNFSNPRRFSLPVLQNFQSPTPTPQIAKPQIMSQISPDGTKLLTMAVTSNKNLTKTYTFSTANSDNINQVQIYSVIYGVDSMSIPFNTWSPDDKYIFINHISGKGNEALVFRADGSPLDSTDSFLNATQVFGSKISGDIYYETTGWASPTLLIINTKKADGTKSTSYWLEVPSKAVIPLASQF